MHLFHIPQSSIQNRNVHISVLNGAFWDMEQVHSGICELGQVQGHKGTISNRHAFKFWKSNLDYLLNVHLWE